MKGIILAGGYGKRLYPLTKPICKQLLPVYDKPLIYYPLSVLMLAGIRDILIISTPDDLPSFIKLFGSGESIGLNLHYAEQSEPKGIAEAFIIGEHFINQEKVCLILGDNIFFGHGLKGLLRESIQLEEGALVIGYNVSDPTRYGIVEFGDQNNVLSIEEKPLNPRSNWAVVGLYFYDKQVVQFAKSLKPSKRGELEITDINKIYLRNKQLKVKLMGRGYAWLDTGTHQSLIDASGFIKTIEERQGLKIACIEEIAYQNGWINKAQVKQLADEMNDNQYGKYLLGIINPDHSLNLK